MKISVKTKALVRKVKETSFTLRLSQYELNLLWGAINGDIGDDKYSDYYYDNIRGKIKKFVSPEHVY